MKKLYALCALCALNLCLCLVAVGCDSTGEFAPDQGNCCPDGRCPRPQGDAP